MTQSRARAVANAALVTAGVATAYVVLTTPSLRKLAVAGLRWWLGASIPVYLTSQVRQAWMESGRTA
jgi:hypothetical protein